MFIRLFEENPSLRHIRNIVNILEQGGIVVYPTDTVYAIGCDINNKSAVEKIARLKGIDPKKSNFSIICADLSQVSEYTKHLDTPIFKLLKRNLPGPFTFILPAGQKLPAHFKTKRRQIGIRIPNNNIVHELVKEFGRPIMTSSIKDDDDTILEYNSDPELIYERFQDIADCVIDGGYGNLTPSTIVSCVNGGEFEVIRQGLGELLN